EATIGKMPVGHHALFVAAGIYDETLDVFHGRQVAIFGPTNPDGSCQFVSRIRRVIAQDNSTVWINCLRVGQIMCRQWSIVDAVRSFWTAMGSRHSPPMKPVVSTRARKSR